MTRLKKVPVVKSCRADVAGRWCSKNLGVNSTRGFWKGLLSWRRKAWNICAGVVAFTTNMLARRSAWRRMCCTITCCHTSCKCRHFTSHGHLGLHAGEEWVRLDARTYCLQSAASQHCLVMASTGLYKADSTSRLQTSAGCSYTGAVVCNTAPCSHQAMLLVQASATIWLSMIIAMHACNAQCLTSAVQSGTNWSFEVFGTNLSDMGIWLQTHLCPQCLCQFPVPLPLLLGPCRLQQSHYLHTTRHMMHALLSRLETA